MTPPRHPVPTFPGLPARRQAPGPLSRLAFVAAFLTVTTGLATTPAHAQSTGLGPEPAAERQQQLVRVVRQDCGSCHGMRLTGGLGPALTVDRMADYPLDSLLAVIRHGRPGTPMPGWAPMLSEADARWIAQRLQQGFPQEAQTLRSLP